MNKLKIITLIIICSGIVSTTLPQSDSYLKNRILVEGCYIRNLGNFSEDWGNASGGYIGYGLSFPEHNFLILRVGFINNNYEFNVEEASLTMIPIEIGGRYYFFDDRFMPFVQFINGLNLVFENTNLEGESEDKTMVKYAWQIGFGLTVNIINDLNVDVGVNYQSNFYQHDAMNTGFEYAFGIGYAFGN